MHPGLQVPGQILTDYVHERGSVRDNASDDALREVRRVYIGVRDELLLVPERDLCEQAHNQVLRKGLGKLGNCL